MAIYQFTATTRPLQSDHRLTGWIAAINPICSVLPKLMAQGWELGEPWAEIEAFDVLVLGIGKTMAKHPWDGHLIL
eukprot:s166_g7.t1